MVAFRDRQRSGGGIRAQAGQELNVMMPLIAYELLYSQSYLARAVQLLPTGPCADRRERGKVPELDGEEASGLAKRSTLH